MRIAEFWRPEGDDNLVRCLLCPHNCVIADSKVGRCKVRKNQEGILYSLNYSKVCAVSIDPIEKKPLYHFLPSKPIFSLAAFGCNMSCKFCQNWQISQDVSTLDFSKTVSPSELIDACKSYNCEAIACTYSEPVVFYELAKEVCLLAKKEGIFTVFVTNGFVSEDVLDEWESFLDAANVDIKFFDDKLYKEICGASLFPVLKCIEKLVRLGVWVEVTTLIIPGLNDQERQLRQIAEFIADLDVDIPWHISAFHPAYEMMDASPTPVEALCFAEQIGKEVGLNYIYLGNVVGMESNTYCPDCKKILIRRVGFRVLQDEVTPNGGFCPYCGRKVAGIWGTFPEEVG